MGQEFFVYNITLSLALFAFGTIAVLWQRNALSVFMGVELMLNAANLALITFAQRFGDPGGTPLVLFIITVAAAEAGVGFAIFIRFYTLRKTIDPEEATDLQG